MAVGLAALAVTVALPVPPASATVVLYVGGTTGTLGRLVPAGTFGTTDDLLGGALRGDPVTVVDYPASLGQLTGPSDPALGPSIAIGAAAVEAAVAAKSGPLVIIGTSQGAMVVQQVAAQLNDDPAVPSDTTFVLTADPNLGAFLPFHGVSLPGLDYTPEALPQTRFNVIVVINQYDGFADPPTQPSNRLAVLNALLGIAYVHPFAQNTNLSTVPAQDITTTTNQLGGVTTVYHVPTPELPLTMPLRQLGAPAASVDALDALLRPIIDGGYQAPTPASARPDGRASARPRNSVTRSRAVSATANASTRPSVAAGSLGNASSPGARPGLGRGRRAGDQPAAGR